MPSMFVIRWIMVALTAVLAVLLIVRGNVVIGVVLGASSPDAHIAVGATATATRPLPSTAPAARRPPPLITRNTDFAHSDSVARVSCLVGECRPQ